MRKLLNKDRELTMKKQLMGKLSKNRIIADMYVSMLAIISQTSRWL